MKIEAAATKAENKGLLKKKNQARSTSVLFDSLLRSTAEPTPTEPVSEIESGGLDIESSLQELDNLGKELLLRRSMGALNRYTQAIKSILKGLDPGYETRASLTHGEHGSQHRKLFITREIDRSVGDLARQVMETERGNLELAHSIDNIKGLLLDYLR